MPPPLETSIQNQKLHSGTCRDRELEEVIVIVIVIIIIIIINASPSTIHDSPIHV
jgi:hypothetical protein